MKYGGWGWLLVFVPLVLALFAVVGIVQGIKKTQRDEKGNAIKPPKSSDADGIPTTDQDSGTPNGQQ